MNALARSDRRRFSAWAEKRAGDGVGGASPGTESLILLIATLESRRESSARFSSAGSRALSLSLWPPPPLPSLYPKHPAWFLRSRGREPSHEQRTNRRRLSGSEDKPCLPQDRCYGGGEGDGGGRGPTDRTGKRSGVWPRLGNTVGRQM